MRGIFLFSFCDFKGFSCLVPSAIPLTVQSCKVVDRFTRWSINEQSIDRAENSLERIIQSDPSDQQQLSLAVFSRPCRCFNHNLQKCNTEGSILHDSLSSLCYFNIKSRAHNISSLVVWPLSNLLLDTTLSVSPVTSRPTLYQPLTLSQVYW